MQIGREDSIRMERAHVRAWPALNIATIDGWLWRSSGGGSQRANSVSTVDFNGNDVQASIVQVESRYFALGQPARFQTFDETSPPGLADLLRKRGYKLAEPTLTMFKRIETACRAPSTDRPCMSSDVEARDHTSPEWLSVYLGEITENRRAVNKLILDRIHGPPIFLSCRRDGEVVATALGVVSFGCAVIECVTTRSDRRRQGAARSVLAALEQWAGQQSVDWIGLQVAADNRPAVALYQHLGFVSGATNNFWFRQ